MNPPPVTSAPTSRAPSPPLPRRLQLTPFLALLTLALAHILSGCSTVRYYSQAVHGHFQIQSKRVRIDHLLQNPDTDESLKKRLQQVLELRTFAAQQLGLPAGRNYLRYADLQRPHVVWTVHATPQFSLQSKKWWYPFVGRLKYRGFFDAEHAENLARQLRKDNHDVFIGGVDAYSTLGWFSDPVLNTFIHRESTSLADLLFHELAHRRYFRHGDTDFNEAFATFIAETGVRQWIQSRPATEQPELLAQFERSQERDRILIASVQKARKDLAKCYQGVPASGPRDAAQLNAVVQEKQRILDRLQQELDSQLTDPATGKALVQGPWNNARLNTVATYHDLVPQFRKRFEECQGDLSLFLRSIRSFHPQRESEKH